MKVHLRIATSLGPRTIVTQHLSDADARAIAAGLDGLGITCHVDDDTSVLSIAEHIARKRKTEARAARRNKPKAASAALPPANTIPFKRKAQA